MNIAEREIPPAPGRVLVTGGAGFIGSHFVDHLLADYPGFKITVLDKLTYAGSVDNLPMADIEFVYGDVCNAALVSKLVATCTHVVHFAAETHVTRSIAENRLFFETDVIGTQTVLNACLEHREKIRGIIHVSTSEVYGTARLALGEKMDEGHDLAPLSPYAAAKCGADRLAWSYYATYRLPITIVRPFNNYGPRQHIEKVVPRFITCALLNESLPIHGGGHAERDFVYVGDTVRAIAKLMLVAGMRPDIYNIASGTARSVLSIASDVLALYPHAGLGRVSAETHHCTHHLADRPGQVDRHIGDSARLALAIDWAPAVAWLPGLSATLDWYTQHQDRWEGQLWARESVIRTAAGDLVAH